MYLIGVLFAAYYDWCLRRTAERPGLWALGIGLVQFPLMCLLWMVPPVWILVVYPAIAVVFVPAYFAAERNSRQHSEGRVDAWQRTKHLQKLIKMGKKLR